jgi:predicted AlkP superfamily phosphohydrolase/phosphomutase
MNRKVLVIGLDGGTFSILDPLMEGDKLPHIQEIMDKGFRSILLSTVPPVSAPAWASFITGKNPGKHGVLQFYDIGPVPMGESQTELEIRPGDFAIVNARSIRARTLWQIASEAGRKMIIINVPMTYPPTPINGIMITGLLTPPGSTHLTYPPELAASLKGYEIDLTPEEKDFDSPGKRQLIERQRAILEKRWETSIRLMKEFDWDLFMVVFTGTDRLQHRFWRCLDPGANGDPAELKEYYDLLEEYYERLDWIVGDLVRQAGEDVYAIILSDHGFGTMPQREVNTHLLLKELGVVNQASGSNWATFLRSFLNKIGLDAHNRQKYLGKVMPRAWLRKAEQVGLERVWNVSKARIVTLHTNVGGIWINVKGGEKDGLVESGMHYEGLRDQLISNLCELQDPINGAKIVSNVFKREELYTGELLRKIPDLVFMLSSDYKLSGGTARSDSFVSREATSSTIQGDHLPEGILMISGKGVRNLRSQTDFEIEDVTTTILHLLGIPVPTDMDGRVVLDAFDEDFLRDNPIESVNVSSSSEPSKIDATPPLWESDQDQKNVEERLRSLGYLD